MIKGYQHPVNYQASGDVAADLKYAAEIYDSNLGKYPPQDKHAAILDVGCGWGQFLLWLRAKGYTAARGIDLGDEQERYCRSLGLNVTQVEDSTAFLKSHPTQFQMISMHHVIEHMPASEGVELLRAAYSAL